MSTERVMPLLFTAADFWDQYAVELNERGFKIGFLRDSNSETTRLLRSESRQPMNRLLGPDDVMLGSFEELAPRKAVL